MNLTVIVSQVIEGLKPFFEATVVVFTLVGLLAAAKITYILFSKWRSQWRSHGKKL